MSNSIKYEVIMIEMLVYSYNASLIVSGLKCSVHIGQKKLGVLLKNGGLLIQEIRCIFQEKQGFIPRKANGFGWSGFTKVCVGYYNNALKDTKLVKRRETQSKNRKERETGKKKLIVEDKPAFPEGSYQKSPRSDLN